MKKFDTSVKDAQATTVISVSPEKFDFDEYAEYAANLNEKCDAFWKARSGVLVYRRMRVADCFSYGCRDMKASLENQLGALKKSMIFKADVPNFLEPWYGIGTIASAFGSDYTWIEGHAPAMKPSFRSLDEIFCYKHHEVANTAIGRHTLCMTEYFTEKTKGRLPISLTDTQSPLNIAGYLLPLDKFLISFLTEPEKVLHFFDILASLSSGFNNEQLKIIRKSLVCPGHGFASSVCWKGLGMSDDNILMISPEQYLQIAAPSVEKICKPFGGPAFHSCGNWTPWIDAVMKVKGLLTADGAFSPETDPDAITSLETFHRMAGKGIVLNARIVGDADTIEQQVRRLWVPGMKLIVVTYCPTPEEQTRAYDLIHEICQT
ncbi:MAG: hypothetical protein JXR41_15870 [Bacteroidales bacterium]|nr:hypothetical protein [Bacteroidales bacterium]MBN2764573.1 hypothetical protein [Bacteroidales bacterium]